MNRTILILAEESRYGQRTHFTRCFRSLGEWVEEISHLYSMVRERDIELILVPDDFPGVNTGVIKRLRMRSPDSDIWRVSEGMPEQPGDEDLYDGIVDYSAGPDQVADKVARIINQRALLKKYGMVGRSERLKMVAETIDRIAPTDITVLIVGPSGSGKELVARAVHDNSPRSKQPFVAINCGALAEGILESELFGHEKGAFTGSVGRRTGLFLQAAGGPIFLDEIGETKPDMQVKLLRVLEDGYFYPVGGDKPIRTDARVIAATNRDLSEAIGEGHFREDLYFRLGVVKIILPALYERRSDILPLLFHFASQYRIRGFSDSALDRIMRYDWPGNVRQLKNFIAGMAALNPDREIGGAEVERFISEQSLHQKNLPVITGSTPEEAGHELIYRALISLGNEIRMLRDLITANLPSRDNFETENHEVEEAVLRNGASLKEMERSMIKAALKATGGNRKAAADRLGIGERTLYRKLKDYNLN